MVQIFAVIAMIRNARHWQVQDTSVEIRPWAPSAAELINEHLPKEYLEKGIALNAGVAVAFGIGTMVVVRMQQDVELQRARNAERTTSSSQDPRRHPQEPSPPNNVTNIPRQPPAGAGAGGAAPTRPADTLDGLGMQTGGLG